MNTTRKLLTIFYADVADYSRLTGLDEEGTHRRVMAILDQAADAIRAAGGTVLRYAGDAVLASFPSVVDAVKTAVAIQSYLADKNETDDCDEPIHIRIGINLGDVIEDRGEVYGDGVNLAARLESVAQPGGICVSSLVHGQVNGKIDLSFRDGGPVEFKNISSPVSVFHWAPDNLPPPKASPTGKRKTAQRKAALAILPFANMSNDPEQEHFADGLTEDLISMMSRKGRYDVTARNSTFVYKGQSVDIRSVGKDLGVDYVLEGSVRKSGNRVRITVQLIDAKSGNHDWSDKFDRELDEIFSVQDEITNRVSAVLGETIWQSVAKSIDSIDEGDYGPYELCYSSIGLIHQLDPRANRIACDRLKKAYAIDPDLPLVHLGLGFCHLIDCMLMGDDLGGSLEKAHKLGEEFRKKSPNDANVYRLLSRLYLGQRKFEEAKRCVDRSVSLDPSDSDIVLNKALYLLMTGDAPTALDLIDSVLAEHQETPHTVDIARLWKSLTLFALGDYDQAVFSLNEISGLSYIKNLFATACYTELGAEEQARQAASIVRDMHPGLSVSKLGIVKGFQDQSIADRFIAALQRAGLNA